ncbi:MAG: protease SohB [Agarilytica sp.]
MEFLSNYGLFLAKTATIVIAIAAVIIMGIAASMRQQGSEKGHLEVTKLNDKLNELADAVKSMVLDQDDLKSEEKAQKEKEKELKKEKKLLKKKQKEIAKKKSSDESEDDEKEAAKQRIFVTDFDGDIKASATEELREVISAILSIATEKDEVVLRLESSGGMVHSYGLAASQLRRITEKNIPLTICVDKVAASGGYMMACVANKIISAPFAIIGSIGVVAQLPNFNRLLKKHDVEYEMFTAGEYKRTLTMFGENTKKGREKFQEELEDTHVLFKDFITENRPGVEVEEVATGEIWFGTRAIERCLVDELQTSDQYLFDKHKENDIFEIQFVHKKTLTEKLGMNVENAMENVVARWVQRFNRGFLS